MKAISKQIFERRVNDRIIQILGGYPYWTRYFMNEPIINPPIHMAGQVVYRSWVLEDVWITRYGRNNKKIVDLLIADDHAYQFILPIESSQLAAHHEITDDYADYLLLIGCKL